MAPRLEALSGQPRRLVVSGGTAAILARLEGRVESYDRERIEAVELTATAVHSWVERLWGCNLAERQQTVGLPKSRADVILPGAVIYEGVMESLAFTEFRVSTRGLRFAAVMDPLLPREPAKKKTALQRSTRPPESEVHGVASPNSTGHAIRFEKRNG